MEVAIKPSRFWDFCNLCRKVKPVAWLIIIGDAIHNFADGLALGASAAVSIPLAISTTIAEIFHEVPHELSEFIIMCSGTERFPNHYFCPHLSVYTECWFQKIMLFSCFATMCFFHLPLVFSSDMYMYSLLLAGLCQ